MKIPLSYSYKDFLLYGGQDRINGTSVTPPPPPSQLSLHFDEYLVLFYCVSDLNERMLSNISRTFS